MPVSLEELGRRLRTARENSDLTQQQVADAVGIPRTAVVQIEAGKRTVNSLELEKLAQLFGRGIGDFVNDAPFAGDPVAALLRVASEARESPQLAGELRRLANVAREATGLEGLLKMQDARPAPVKHDLASPSSRWDAVCQGKRLAGDERRRLGLGDAPVREIAEVVRSQGVRAAEAKLNGDISGVFFFRPETGPVVLVNSRDAVQRRIYSFAHEYCHVLADRDRAAVVSRKKNVEELIEVRANAFAAHFLMPESGVQAFLRALGKGEATRQNQQVFAGEKGEKAVAVQKRAEPGSQELQVHDVVRVAHHFGTSYEAAAYHLLNLGFLTKEQFESLKDRADLASKLRKALQLSEMKKMSWTLAEQVLSLALEARRRGLVSSKKVLELASDVGADRRDVEQAMREEGIEEAAVEPAFPQ